MAVMTPGQVVKAMNLCSRLADAATRVMVAVEDLAALKDEKESSGLDLTDDGGLVDDALEASTLAHATGVDFENVISSGSLLKSWLETNFHDDIFQKVRS